MMNDTQLLENKSFREEYIGHTDVLDKVKELILLPNTEFGTLEQVSNYYEVGKEAIETLVIRHKDELENDGYATFKKNKVIEMLNIYKQLENTVGKSIVTLKDNTKIEIPNRGLRLFPKYAILHTAFYLSESEIARQVRQKLLKENPELYYKFSNGNQIRLKKYETEIKNYLEFSFGEKNVKYQVSCGKYYLDFVLFNNIHIEVDEDGHKGYDKEFEKEREFYITEYTNYWTIRYNPKTQKPYQLIFDIFELFNHIGWPSELEFK